MTDAGCNVQCTARENWQWRDKTPNEARRHKMPKLGSVWETLPLHVKKEWNLTPKFCTWSISTDTGLRRRSYVSHDELRFVWLVKVTFRSPRELREAFYPIAAHTVYYTNIWRLIVVLNTITTRRHRTHHNLRTTVSHTSRNISTSLTT